jgi:hypothetical protein
MTEDEKLLEKHGWTLECISPFEIRHEDGSFATGQAARLIVLALEAGWCDDDQICCSEADPD